MITVEWNSHAIAQRDRFLAFSSEWEYFLEHTAKDLMEYAQTYFTPMLASVRGIGNGDTAKSVKGNITMNGAGFEIDYTGLLSAWWMDVGNFPAGATIQAPSYGLKAFPVDKRFGKTTFMPQIHGMGHTTSGVPVHWSEETVKHMSDDGAAFEIMEKWMNVFLDEVVI